MNLLNCKLEVMPSEVVTDDETGGLYPYQRIFFNLPGFDAFAASQGVEGEDLEGEDVRFAGFCAAIGLN